jgi:hypothetical protein
MTIPSQKHSRMIPFLFYNQNQWIFSFEVKKEKEKGVYDDNYDLS